MGCDFKNPNYAYENPSVNAKLPFKNLIQNPSFENNTETAISGWSGSGAAIFSQSTWNYFGSLTKSGNKGVRINSGSAIEQTVTGVKPNTVYETGGYGAVAGVFHSAWERGSSSPHLTVYDQASGFANGRTEYISYGSYVLDAGYDTIVFGIQIAAGKGSIDKSITLRDGTADGDILISCPISGSGTYNDNGYMWDWVSAEIPEELRGRVLNNVCLVFEGDGFNNYGGYYLKSSQNTEKITMTARSGDSSNSIDITDSVMPSVRPTMEITTDGSGEVTLEISKSSGNMFGYADDVFLREKFVPSAAANAECEVENIKICDTDGKLIYGIRPGGKHVVSGTVLNTSSLDKSAVLTLKAHSKDGSEYGKTETSVDVSAHGSAEFSIEIYAHMLDGAYFTLTASDNIGKTIYTITDKTLESQHGDSEAVFVKTVAVYNQEGDVLNSVVPGEFNLFSVTAVNPTAEENTMLGVLAVYDENGSIIKTVSFKRKMVSGENTYAFGTVIPDGRGAYAKLFTWTDLTNIEPLADTAVFR